MNIGDKVAALRKQKSMSQTDLARVAAVSREIIGIYERNEVIPSVEVAKKIADAFDVSLDHLVGGVALGQLGKFTVKRMQDIEKLSAEDKSHVFALLVAFPLKTKIQHNLAL
ncbi:MAG: helix-turn-helix transcriptional regulator [Chitinophagaceae bacterium]